MSHLNCHQITHTKICLFHITQMTQFEHFKYFYLAKTSERTFIMQYTLETMTSVSNPFKIGLRSIVKKESSQYPDRIITSALA